MDPIHNPIQAIRPYTGKKFNGKNCSALKFGFVAHRIRYNLKDVHVNDATRKVKNNKIYLILIATLESSQFVLVNKISTLAQAWLAIKSFYKKKGGQLVLLLT
jgi:hypothetical protein